MSTKMTKRELQSPDKFMTTTTQLFDWAGKHPRELAIGGVVLVAVLVAASLLMGGEIRVNPKAGAALADALSLLDREVKAPETAAAAGEADADAEEGAEEETFPSETAKQEAIAAALAKVRADFPGTSSARTATLSLADAKFKLGAYDEALSLYDEFLAKAPKSSSVRFLALEGRATTLQAQKNYDAALAAWDKLAAEAPGYKDRALLGKAVVFESQKKWDDARSTYEELKLAFAGSAAGRLGAERLTSLNFRHPPADSTGAAPAAAAPAAEATQDADAAE